MEEIRTRLTSILKKVFGITDVVVELTSAPEGTGADYATNVAMRLTKLVGKKPREIAEILKQALERDDVLKGVTVTVAGPGFLNLRLATDDLRRQAEVTTRDLGASETLKQKYAGKTIVTEFSDPNPFKVLHVGHLYTSIVGESISRLLERAGAKVVRVNFGGDVGLHVGKTLWAVKARAYKPEDLTIERLAECYVEGTRAYEDDATAKAEITTLNKEIYRISESDERASELAQLYWRGRELSYEYFKAFYARIGVKFDKFYPESAVAGRGLKEVKAHLGTVYEESDGAVVYRGEKVGLHTRVFINREGVPTYEAKDVGLIFTKWDDWRFDESVVITGNEQTDYMKVVLASVKEYAPELVERTQHLTHGLVKLAGNVKMSSRKGNFIRAVDVLDGVTEILREETKDEIDNRIVLAAVKYAFLRYKMGGDIIFNPKESVSMTGNSGVYLLYAVVRAKKILAKISAEDESLNNKIVQQETEVEEEYERRLYKKIIQFDEVLEGAILGKAPYKICAYLYDTAQEFSRFYEHVPVKGSAKMQERKELVEMYLKIMLFGLDVLGIEVPEEM